MNRMTLSLVVASLVIAGSLTAQPPKIVAMKAAPTVTAAPKAAPADTMHKKPAAKNAGKKVTKKHDATAKHDTAHARPKKPNVE